MIIWINFKSLYHLTLYSAYPASLGVMPEACHQAVPGEWITTLCLLICLR